ncbi:MAG: ATP synthase F1 subunit epsilon [Polyangiaceae bacterium]|nr:ATP synthase F1 subunit epsilon [Polyangiaceae bacterium]
MADSINLQIVTPDGVKLSAHVSELTAPSVDGEFGVLPGHRPLLAALRTGIVSYREAGGEQRVAVGGGFVQIAGDVARLLTDNFVTKDEVDVVRSRLELKEADEALDHFTGDPKDPSYTALVQKELWAATKLELYGDPPPPTIRAAEHELVASTENYRHLADPGEAPDA